MTVEEVAAVRVGQRAAGIPPAGDHRRPDAGIHLGDRQPGGGMVEKIALREAIDSLPERERITILLRFFGE